LQPARKSTVKMRKCTKERFDKDVVNHEMDVRLNNGLYRHIIFQKKQNSFDMRFEIITVPNLLTITGDMGTWSFSRLPDMFNFFRSSDGTINEHYWSSVRSNADKASFSICLVVSATFTIHRIESRRI